MKKLLKRLLLFLLLNIAVLAFVLISINFVFTTKNWDSDPDIFIIPENKSYDAIFMGTSHGEIFTRFDNQKKVEEIIEKRFFNISQPNAGPVMEKLYLKYFLENKNTAKTIVYFIDPHVFYSDKENENYHLLSYGKFDLNFLKSSFENDVSYKTSFNSLITYLSLKWFIKEPRKSENDMRVWKKSKIDEENRIKQLYPDGSDDKLFQRYKKTLEEITFIAKENNMKIIFILPATQIEKQPGKDKLLEMLKTQSKNEKIEYCDLSNSVEDINLFSDVDHLNTKGVLFFSEKYLLPILNKENIPEKLCN